MGELCLLGYPIMTIPVWDKFPVVIIIANECVVWSWHLIDCFVVTSAVGVLRRGFPPVIYPIAGSRW